MEDLRNLEIVITLAVQSLGSAFLLPMKIFSFLGTEEFFLIMMPTLYWCIDSTIGLKTALLMLIGNGINHTLKVGLQSSRPFWRESLVLVPNPETTYGLPSNHAQISATIWGYLSKITKSPLLRWIFLAIIFFIGFSRIYLGVHYITDVLAGWFIGWLTLVVFFKYEQKFGGWIKSISFRNQLLFGILVSLGLMLIMLLQNLLFQPRALPQFWLTNIEKVLPLDDFKPLDPSNAFTISGTFLGLCIGVFTRNYKNMPFSAHGASSQRVLRFFVGMVGIGILWYGLGKIFPRNDDFLSYTLRYFRYILIGSWVTLFAPILFGLLKLTENKK